MTIEIRPGVERPDWSVVTSAAVRDALQARSRSRPGPVEAWSVALQPAPDLVWRATLELFARLGRPPLPVEIAEGTNFAEIAVQVLLSELEGYDLLGVVHGAISYAYPFTARRTAHRVRLHGQMLHAVCAIDALGVGAMCGADVVIESACRACGAAISIETTQHGLALCMAQPGDTVVWYDLMYDGNAVNSCCPSIAFFCRDEHLEQWTAEQATPPTGQRLALVDAFEMGRALFEPVLKPAMPARVPHLY
jgi:alkylmercury lyase